MTASAARPRLWQGAVLPAAVRAQADRLVRDEWPWLGREALDAELHLALLRGPALVAYAALVAAAGAQAGRRLRLRGLSNVVTAPAERGRGHGTRLVAAAGRAIDTAAGASATRAGSQVHALDAALLFCEPELAPFYERLGWRALPPGALRVAGRAAQALVMGRFPGASGARTRRALAEAPIELEHAW